VWELSREHEIPCTFSEGVAASFTRPGRAVIAFLEWIRQDFAADVLREALVSGSIRLPPAPGEEAPVPARAAAREMREASIGWTRERHRRGLERRIAELSKPEKPRRGDEDSTPEDDERRAQARARRKQAALAARDFVWRALDLAPRSLEEPADLPAFARSARQFVREFGRVADELDGAAATALDTLFAELEELPSPRLTAAEAAERLREAVSGLSVAADRPRPGRVHVAPFRDGGFSGRTQTFLVGLDEGRHPGRDLEDPILLDEERARINEASAGARRPLQRERPRETAASLRACVARLRGRLTASYSSFGLRNLSQAGEPAPSPFLLDLFRERSGRPDADYEELGRALPAAAGFVPEADRALDETEWWLSRRSGASAGGAASVRAAYPWLADGDRARLARAGGEFTVYDGWVRSGTPELDPRGSSEPFSATRIQALAACPFSYFLKHVLRLEPPEDPTRNPARWLEPIDEGSLLHEVFRIFLEEITEAGEKPNAERHLARIERIADERIEEWKDRRPVHSRVAFDEQREDIRFACRTFLRLEETHCRDVSPRFFEVGFGQDRPGSRSPRPPASREPVEIAVGGGKRFRLRGSIDRVDQAPDGSFHVWDYKTGSAWAVRDGAGPRGGRQVQPALYAMALEALLERSGAAGRVSRTGYFFPGRKGEGQRILAPLDPAPTREVLRTLFDLLAAGLFPHATSKDGCKHCDFEAVCGGPEEASKQSGRKLAESRHPALTAFRDIHAEKD
jgi:ATP-dependent helicase/nuclease subunit B